MKRLFLCFALTMMAWMGYAQDIMGKWVTEAGDAQDVHNSDEKLRSRKLMGVNILSGLSKKKDKWEGGRIYNPKNGKNYKCSIWVEGKELKVRGYIGFLYETQTWKRK